MAGRRALIAVLVLAAPLAAAPAHASSLYDGPGPRPGPDLLYEPPSRAPQLENTGVWRAPPILVSGATAYRRGEFLYQDFLYDDHGASLEADPSDPRSGDDLFSAPNGTYTYPTADSYAGNTADLVELRVKPLRRHTAFRLTLNTMLDPGLVAATIALGESAEPRELPHGANVRAPAELFLTVHGTRGDLRDAATGEVVGVPRVRVDTERRQIHVLVSHRAWNPGRRTIRMAAGVGLWDPNAGRYLAPRDTADAETPGGAGDAERPAALFNVAFRGDEPMPAVTDLWHNLDPAWWRDRSQGAALAEGDLGRFSADVDFAKLADRRSDNTDVPRTGAMNRILSSRFEPHPGVDYGKGCGTPVRCEGWLGGRLQPYAIYVPERPPPAAGYGLTLLLHSLGASYNQFLASRNQAQFAERAGGSIVVTPAGRGPDGWYVELAEADVFEVWADVARRYRLDDAHTAIAGYSMGGYGTFRLATRYPDLFARAQPTVGPPSLGIWAPPLPPTSGDATNTFHMLPSLRHVPIMMWVGVADELVPFPGTQAQADELDRLGYRYVFDAFTGEHLTLAFNDEYGPAAQFLGDARVDRDPARVTYVANPAMDFAARGVVADHAYWVSGVRVREPVADAPFGTVDVRSHGFGVGDPAPRLTERGGGMLAGGEATLFYTRQEKRWDPAPAAPTANRLDVAAENVAALTIDPARARVGCDAQLEVTTDGPLEVTLAGCGRTERFGR